MPGVAILGTGWGAKVQMGAFRAAGLDVIALGGRSLAKTRAIAARFAIPHASTDVDSILGRSDVNLVSIATPPDTHAALAIAVLKAGKHALCEKPTALNAAEAAAMLAAARAHPDRLSLIDHELRFLPTRRRMRELVGGGYLGELLEVEAAFLGPGRLGEHAWDWWSQRERGGGVLAAVGSHLVDSLRWLVDRTIGSVSALLTTHFKERLDESGLPREVTSDEACSARLRFSGGILGTLHMSAVTAGPRTHRILLAGSEGSLWWENGRLQGFRNGEPEELGVADEVTLPAGLPDTEWARGTVFFARALRPALASTDRSSLSAAATFADGLATQRILDAAVESNGRDGAWVRVEESG